MSMRLGSPVVPAAAAAAGHNMSVSPAMSSNDESSKKVLSGRETFISRVLGAIFWTIALQCVFVSLVLFLMNIDVLHPIKWIKSTSNAVYSVRTWFYLFPIGVVTFAQGVLTSKDYVMGTPCIRTRFGILSSVLLPRNVVMVTLSMVFGAMVVSYYSALLGDGAVFLTKKCGVEESRCLHEHNLYLLANGLWIGLYISLKQQLWETRILLFPIIHQLKYPQVKNQLPKLIHKAVGEAVLPTLYFLLMYPWVGGVLREHASGFLGVATEEDHLDSLLSQMQPWLIPRAVLYYTIVILTGRTMEMLFQVHLTEPSHFPISTSVNQQVTLQKAISSPLPLMQQLGYQDLLRIAERDPLRRSELFSLSLPGGHPHNWNGVACEVLKTLNDFTSEISTAVLDVNRTGPSSALPTSTFPPYPSRISSPTSPSLSPNQTSPKNLRLRNMSLLVSDDGVRGCPGTPLHQASSMIPQKVNLMGAVKQQISNLVQWARRKPGINLLFGELEDARVRHLLLHSQHFSWAVQALAHLASASLTKDAYGVVQKDLQAIIKTLVNLKSALERLPSSPHKRAFRPDSLDLRMKAALLSSVKRSLYIICDSFGQYFSELSLPQEIRQQLTGFVLFKEG